VARNYKEEYKDFHSKPDQKKRRAGRNAARRKMTAAGKVKKGDGKDVHHKDGNTLNNKKKNLRVESRSKNRARKK
jgi:hypothetical protein|tara:strand:+ start:1047 stop:1271 length:225 start_codon:yes stop_codon:yes gene_type:complete